MGWLLHRGSNRRKPLTPLWLRNEDVEIIEIYKRGGGTLQGGAASAPKVTLCTWTASIKNANILEEMQQGLVEWAIQSLEKYNTEKGIWQVQAHLGQHRGRNLVLMWCL